MNFKPVLMKLSAVAAEEIAWLWQPYLPLGKVTILDGLPGTGKTYFALALAAALSIYVAIHFLTAWIIATYFL